MDQLLFLLLDWTEVILGLFAMPKDFAIRQPMTQSQKRAVVNSRELRTSRVFKHGSVERLSTPISVTLVRQISRR